MTLRNSFAGLPPFLFGDGGLHNQLVCDVRTYVRANDGNRDLVAPMLAWSPGPPAIGDTGDNSPGHMMGTTWLLQVCPDGSWVLYREDRGHLTVVPFDDPPDHVTATARRVSLCFDQSARVALAWEDQGIIKVRRWDPSENEYIENVSFAGADPVLFFDAWLAAPEEILSPNEAAAVRAGLGYAFEWLPIPAWLDNPIVDSDVLVFYLSADRERVMCRVQRQLYATEHVIHDYGIPIVLDNAVPAGGRIELLVSAVDGSPLPQMLLSDPYVGDVLLRADADDGLSASVTPENLAAVSDTYVTDRTDPLDATVAPENLAAVGSLLSVTDEDALDAGVQPENMAVVGNVYLTTDDDALNGSVTPEDIEARVMVIPASDEDALTGGITVENIRVQTV